jgi:hypothetical protein
VGFAVFEDSLNHSTAIRVSGKDVDLASESIDGELDMFCGHSLDGFLDNVVAVLVFDALEDVWPKLFHQLCLLVCEDVLQGLGLLAGRPQPGTATHLLYNSTSIHLHGQFHYMILHLLSQDTLLYLVPVFEELLNDIVAEDISHQLKCVWLDFAE